MFDPDYYRQVLATQGLSPDQYRLERDRTDRLMQLVSAIGADFISNSDRAAAANIVLERRIFAI